MKRGPFRSPTGLDIPGLDQQQQLLSQQLLLQPQLLPQPKPQLPQLNRMMRMMMIQRPPLFPHIYMKPFLRTKIVYIDAYAVR